MNRILLHTLVAVGSLLIGLLFYAKLGAAKGLSMHDARVADAQIHHAALIAALTFWCWPGSSRDAAARPFIHFCVGIAAVQVTILPFVEGLPFLLTFFLTVIGGFAAMYLARSPAPRQ